MTKHFKSKDNARRVEVIFERTVSVVVPDKANWEYIIDKAIKKANDSLDDDITNGYVTADQLKGVGGSIIYVESGLNNDECD
jgi:hypothetical protein